MKYTPIAVAALLAGCVYTTKEVREEGYKSTHHFKRNVISATNCISDNTENMRAFVPSQRKLNESGGVELIIRFNNSSSVMAIAHIEPSGTESIVTLWMNPAAPLSHSEFARQFMEGC